LVGLRPRSPSKSLGGRIGGSWRLGAEVGGCGGLISGGVGMASVVVLTWCSGRA